MEQSSLQFFGRLILVTILVLAAVWILQRFLPALAWAGVLAIATWPIREWLTRKGTHPSITAILLALSVGVLIVCPLVTLAIQMAREANVVVQTVRELREAGLGTPE
jgi:predicted PurR-regulated permease PerM